MKKLLLVLPTLLLLAAPVSVLAEKDNHSNHGSQVSVVAKDNEDNHGAQVSQVAKDNHGHNDNDENEELNENEGNHHSATSEAKEKLGNLKIKVKVDLDNRGHHSATSSATQSATPSAGVKVSGPLDQVIQALEKILSFLKGLL